MNDVMNLRSLILGLCIPTVALLAGCDNSSARKAEERAFDALGVKPLPGAAEIERQRTGIESLNRCLGLLESVAVVTDQNILAALKERGISQITSEEILPLLSKANALERESALPDDEIKAIARTSRSLLGSSPETRQKVNEIADCIELSRIEARNFSR